MAKNDCMCGCVHYKTREKINSHDFGFGIMNEFMGYEHYCDKCPEAYNKWWEENKHKTSKDAADMPCYEPNEIVKPIREMIALGEEILHKVKKEGK